MKNSTRRNKWEKTRVENLMRYVPSGKYYARLRVGGKLIWRSLETDTLSVAKIKLPDVQREERARVESSARVLGRDATFGDALAAFEKSLAEDVRLKPGAKLYRHKCIAALLKSWTGLRETRIAKVRVEDCQSWAAKFAARYSPTVFNNTLGTLAMVLEIGVKNGIRYRNPAREIKRVKVRQRQLHLPSQGQFERLVAAVENGHGRFSRDCADLVRFLAFGGFRKTEAANIAWADCDFEREQIHVRITKNGDARYVPMIPDMAALLERLRAEQPHAKPGDAVMQVRECQKAIDRAAAAIGCPRITHHDLRHLFATRCIESGVDVPTVSRWLGHKDGGALAMKIYGHLREHHSAAMAKRVTFSTAKPTNIVSVESEVAA